MDAEKDSKHPKVKQNINEKSNEIKNEGITGDSRNSFLNGTYNLRVPYLVTLDSRIRSEIHGKGRQHVNQGIFRPNRAMKNGSFNCSDFEVSFHYAFKCPQLAFKC